MNPLTLQQNQSPRETNQSLLINFNSYSTTSSESSDEESWHERKSLLSYPYLSQSTNLHQRSITNPFGIFPLEIWQLIFNFCSTRTLTMLMSVSKNMLLEISKIESLEDAQTSVQKFMKNSTGKVLNQIICTYTGVLSTEQIGKLERLDYIIDLPPQELLNNNDITDTETQSIFKVLSQKVQPIIGGLISCSTTIFVILVILIIVGLINNWDSEQMKSAAKIISFLSIPAVCLLLLWYKAYVTEEEN